MSGLTRNWVVGTVAGWVLLVYGWCADSTPAIGAAVVLFLLLAVERWDNYQRGRRCGGAR